MKRILISFLFLFFFVFSQSQNPGRILNGTNHPKAGEINSFTYLPPGNLAIPKKLMVLITYENKHEYFSKIVAIEKKNNSYRFNFKAPDSTAVLICGIFEPAKKVPDKNSLVRERKNIIDNNAEAGYIIQLFDSNDRPFPNEKIEMAEVLTDHARYELNLKKPAYASLIAWYEETYRLHPEYKNEDSYVDYLTYLYREKQDSVKTLLLAYASQMMQADYKESNLNNAGEIYRVLKMDEAELQVRNKILTVFPNGKMAKDNYWQNFKPLKTEQEELAELEAYQKRFQDTSSDAKNRFYYYILGMVLRNKDWPNILKYENLITDKVGLNASVGYTAWKLSGRKVDNPGEDLEFAKILSKMALDNGRNLLKQSAPGDDNYEDLQDEVNKYADTYALILYKLKNYDSAFYYQNMIYNQGKELDAGGLERYAAYAQQVKGAAFTRQFIEKQLLNGVKSPAMLAQLKSIYSELGLPANEYEQLQNRSAGLVQAEQQKEIKAKYGSVKAKELTLKDLSGKTVSLSSFKNKVVVLDFWASWCVPCKASFPSMQKLANTYKNDSSVVFLFIDVWENKTEQKMREDAGKYLKDNNYSFNVLFDPQGKATTDFKIQAIPKQFVIDKKGNIIYTGKPEGYVVDHDDPEIELAAIIEKARGSYVK